MSSLESILSGEREPAPVEATTTPAATPETTQEQPQGQPEPSSTDEPQADETGKVPLAALHAERSKVKRYTEQVAEFQSKLEQQNAQWEARFAQMMSAVMPKQAQPEPASAPDFWEDPQSAIRMQASELVNPLQQRMLAMAREVAEVRYQPDAVKAAEEAFNAAAAARQIDPVEYNRIQSSPNPFAAAVQWHQKTTAMAEIGADPAAYKAKLEQELREKLKAEFEQGNTPPAATERPAPVMPGNFATGRNVGARSGPAYAGPPSLEDIIGTRR